MKKYIVYLNFVISADNEDIANEAAFRIAAGISEDCLVDEVIEKNDE